MVMACELVITMEVWLNQPRAITQAEPNDQWLAWVLTRKGESRETHTAACFVKAEGKEPMEKEFQVMRMRCVFACIGQR